MVILGLFINRCCVALVLIVCFDLFDFSLRMNACAAKIGCTLASVSPVPMIASGKERNEEMRWIGWRRYAMAAEGRTEGQSLACARV